MLLKPGRIALNDQPCGRRACNRSPGVIEARLQRLITLARPGVLQHGGGFESVEGLSENQPPDHSDRKAS